MSDRFTDLTDDYPKEVVRGEHPAFKFELLNDSEIDLKAGKFLDSMQKFDAWIRGTHEQMASFRKQFENEWTNAEQEYELANERTKDAGREASTFLIDPDNIDGDEFGQERASVSLPVGYEVTEQIAARMYEVCFGSDQDRFVEIRGRERSDSKSAETAEAFMNFQQGYQINTPLAGLAWCRSAALYGTGIMAQMWDFIGNKRIMKHVSIWDAYFDPTARTIEDCRYAEWRQWMTVREARELRDKSKFGFTDAAFEASVSPSDGTGEVDQEAESIVEWDKALDNDYKRIPVDIFMQKDRWIYRLNNTLIVSITDNQVPPVMFTGEDGTPRIVEQTYPLHVFSPVPGLLKKNKRRSVYGLSHATLGKPIIDIMNSILYLMNKNLARSCLGVIFGDPTALDGFNTNRALEAGMLYPCRDPKNSLYQMDFKDVTPQCLSAMAVLNQWLERLHGVNDSVRGQSTSASKTKTATQSQQDLGEATMRLKTMFWSGINCIRGIYDVGLRLNKAYLEPTSFTRIVGEEGIKTLITRGDLAGISGLDLQPTGFPLSGSRSQIIQQGQNTIGLITQSAQQGVQGLDVKPLLRQVIRAQGWKNVDEIVGIDQRPGQDADDENEFILQGIPVQVLPNDNHVRHFDTHFTLYEHPVAQEQFEREPVILQSFEEHLNVHARFRDEMEPQEQSEAGGEDAPGAGIAGQNTEVVTARPKPQSELEAQLQEVAL